MISLNIPVFQEYGKKVIPLKSDKWRKIILPEIIVANCCFHLYQEHAKLYRL